MTLALSIVQARVNNERQLDAMTVEKAFDIFREYENFPPVFMYKGLKFIKFGESDSETTRKKFAKVIREIDVDGFADTREFEYVNHGTNYKGFSISFEQSEDSSDDNVCNVQVSDKPSRDFRIDRPGSADLLKAALDQAIAKIDAVEASVPRWAKSTVTVLGKAVKFKIDINSDGSLLIRGRSGWSKSIDISHETSSDVIRVSISAKPVGQTSNRTFVFKIPVSVAESGKLSSKINELCAAKKIYAKPPVDATVVSVDVGGFKQEFKVKDAVAFKRHLLQYLKGN